MKLTLHVPPDSRTDPEYDSFTLLNLIRIFKALANEDTLSRTHCCRHKCLPVCLRAQHLLRTQILCPGLKKMFLILFRNILCPQQMFPSLRSQTNITGNNVFATMRPRLPGPLKQAHPRRQQENFSQLESLVNCSNFRSVLTERQSFSCSEREAIFFLDS